MHRKISETRSLQKERDRFAFSVARDVVVLHQVFQHLRTHFREIMLNNFVVGVVEKCADLLRALVLSVLDKAMERWRGAVVFVNQMEKAEGHHDLTLHDTGLATPNGAINLLRNPMF
jgi:hypothetical protein